MPRLIEDELKKIADTIQNASLKNKAIGVVTLSALRAILMNSECTLELAATFWATAAGASVLLYGADKARSYFFPAAPGKKSSLESLPDQLEEEMRVTPK